MVKKNESEKIIKAEGFDFQVLKTIVKELNDSGILEKEIKFGKMSKKDLVTRFLNCVKGIPDAVENKIPNNVLNLYNAYYDFVDDHTVEIEFKMSVAKREDNEEDKVGKDEKKKTKSSMFINAITKKPMTMAEIKKEKWNDNNGTFYDLFKKLEEEGKAKKDKDGRMSIK